jgi:hypothetical protein
MVAKNYRDDDDDDAVLNPWSRAHLLKITSSLRYSINSLHSVESEGSSQDFTRTHY